MVKRPAGLSSGRGNWISQEAMRKGQKRSKLAPPEAVASVSTEKAGGRLGSVIMLDLEPQSADRFLWPPHDTYREIVLLRLDVAVVVVDEPSL